MALASEHMRKRAEKFFALAALLVAFLAPQTIYAQNLQSPARSTADWQVLEAHSAPKAAVTAPEPTRAIPDPLPPKRPVRVIPTAPIAGADPAVSPILLPMPPVRPALSMPDTFDAALARIAPRKVYRPDPIHTASATKASAEMVPQPIPQAPVFVPPPVKAVEPAKPVEAIKPVESAKAPLETAKPVMLDKPLASDKPLQPNMPVSLEKPPVDPERFVVVIDQDLRTFLTDFARRVGLRSDIASNVRGRLTKLRLPAEPTALLKELEKRHDIEWLIEGEVLKVSSRAELATRILPLGVVGYDDLIREMKAIDLDASRFPLRKLSDSNALIVTAPAPHVARIAALIEALKIGKSVGPDLRIVRAGQSRKVSWD